MRYVKDEVKYIRDQYNTAFYGELQSRLGPSLVNIIKNTSFDQAKSKIENNDHSLWEIVLHIITWMEAALYTLQSGQMVNPLNISSWPNILLSKENWDKTKLDMEIMLNNFFEELDSWDNERLKKIIDGTDHDYNTMLTGTLQHLMYHINKIIQ